MAGRLVEHHAIAHPFFDEQKLAVTLDDRCHGEIRSQCHISSIAAELRAVCDEFLSRGSG
jgi:hypothetical protein